MKSILRKHSLPTPAPSVGHTLNTAVCPLMKVSRGLHHGIMGCGLSALTKEMRGV